MRLRVTFVAALAAVAAVTMLLGGAASAAPGSMPTVRNGTGWSGYTTYITQNAKGQPTSKEYYADSRWKVPKLDCNATRHPIIGANSAVAMWVGLGGVGTNDHPESGNLVQAGVLSRCRGYRQTDVAVHQIKPPDSSSIALDAKHPVKAGDSIEATVAWRSARNYSLEINDFTQHWVWGKVYAVSFGNVLDSADYIVESPGTYQADFGSVTFHASNYRTVPPCAFTCPPSFLNEGYAFRFVGVTAFNRDLANVGHISSPVSADPGTFSVAWARGF
ncbi:MAG: hypothetical protein JWL68_2698 [Actinomycetia bacterium]|nr:hypothetical protein [Actinomycetes bacterium]